MEQELGRQAASLGIALLIGAAAGALYEMLRPLRAFSGKYAVIFDVLFSAAVAVGAFVFAMTAGDGRLGLWELTAMLAGFLGFLHMMSPKLLTIRKKLRKNRK